MSDYMLNPVTPLDGLGNAVSPTHPLPVSTTEDSSTTPVGSNTQITNLSSAQSLAAVPAGATQCTVQCLSQPISYTVDGTTTPTATVGFMLGVGKGVVLSGDEMANFQAIEITASAKINYQYEGP